MYSQLTSNKTVRYYRHLDRVLPSRSQLIRDSALTKTDLLEIATCRGEPQRLGFAYQLGFVQVFQRFPVQQPLEICEELQSFIALQRLVACPAKNRFYRANRDLGRVFKTEFLRSYLSEPQLRSRIRRGLLKVEQLHALARDVYYGRRGRINARELHEQMNSCSCLTLILACIIYWQANADHADDAFGRSRTGRHRRHLDTAHQSDRMGQRHPLRPVRA